MKPAYYNEIDKHAAQTLRNLIDAGHISPGVVDERSIEDVLPSDLAGFGQCHFFAGVGVWSYALRQAGWSDDRPVWTGSCPCQPFSASGQGAGFDDKRHLWPHFHHLIKQCCPPSVLGEQVASKRAGPWIDLVQNDLEALGYAFGAVPFPAAGVGAPHIRDRLYWVADANGQQRARASEGPRTRGRNVPGHGGASDRVGHAGHNYDASQAAAAGAGQSQADRSADIAGGSGVSSGGLADSYKLRCSATTCCAIHDAEHYAKSRSLLSEGQPAPGPTNGHWRAADWLACRDGKWRPVEPGSFPLAHGVAGRVGRLRAYGNAICAPAAQAFIEAVMEAQP